MDYSEDPGMVMSFDRVSQRPRTTSSFAAAVCVVAAIALAGCSSGNGVGEFLVDPSLYDAYHCKDLVAQWDMLNKREVELRANVDRASQTATGKVVGAVVYGSDYQALMTQKKMVQQKAAEKKCELTQTYQSDQTVR
jgi:hypothetical protein